MQDEGSHALDGPLQALCPEAVSPWNWDSNLSLDNFLLLALALSLASFSLGRLEPKVGHSCTAPQPPPLSHASKS